MSRWSDERESHPHFEIGVLVSYFWTTAASSRKPEGSILKQRNAFAPVSTGARPHGRFGFHVKVAGCRRCHRWDSNPHARYGAPVSETGLSSSSITMACQRKTEVSIPKPGGSHCFRGRPGPRPVRLPDTSSAKPGDRTRQVRLVTPVCSLAHSLRVVPPGVEPEQAVYRTAQVNRTVRHRYEARESNPACLRVRELPSPAGSPRVRGPGLHLDTGFKDPRPAVGRSPRVAVWPPRWESNPRPLASETSALFAELRGEIGPPGRTRTSNLLIRNQVPYPLSHERRTRRIREPRGIRTLTLGFAIQAPHQRIGSVGGATGSCTRISGVRNRCLPG